MRGAGDRVEQGLRASSGKMVTICVSVARVFSLTPQLCLRREAAQAASFTEGKGVAGRQ